MPPPLYRAALLALCLGSWAACAAAQTAPPQNDSGPNEPQNDSSPAGKPVVVWRFEQGEEPGAWRGKAELGAGPRAPDYPAFAAENRAARFAAGQFVALADGGKRPDLRFGAGDAITLEAWIRVEQLGTGQFAYLLGKGRTREKGRPELNQNYALRLAGREGSAAVSFLFASAAAADAKSEWHRWTSGGGFALDGRWHHVAVTYVFGKPESIRGFCDGQPLAGTWEMGSATARPPVQDDDDLWLGAGNGGGAGNAFRGWMDEAALWREALSAKTLAARYQATTAAPRGPMVDRAKLPPGKVLVEICESGVPEANAWPAESPPATESYLEEAFGFLETPHKYVATGVRGDRPIPYLLRASAVVNLPAGKHRLLLRGRGAARLYIDGKQVLATPFPPPGSDGHNPIPKDYLDLGADFRFAPPGNRERWVAWESKGGEHLVVLETLVGSLTGKQKRRPELGETVVAVSLADHDGWLLLSPASRLFVYNDFCWPDYQAERRDYLDKLNAERRAAARGQHAAYWNKRQASAEKWLATTDEVPVPPLPVDYPTHNAIDHFLAAKVHAAAQAHRDTKPGEIEFHRQVRPLLETRCLDCHRGPQPKGGLRLTSREGALTGGESGDPAFVAGDAAKSELIRRIASHDLSERMPPRGDALTGDEIALVTRWVQEGAIWPEFPPERLALPPVCDDLTFLRRVTLDTVGVLPSLDEIRGFQADARPDKRARAIDRLLGDRRGADHWMGYWQDVLAENPNILNPTLNNTGPFRWWIYESLLDEKPLDLFVTELVRMQGSERFGGPAGFGTASQNDVPLAARATVVSTAFLGVELKCARCHDAPYHAVRQEQLFQLAALLERKPLEVPKSSSVPLDKLHAGGRTPLIAVTLKPGTKVAPAWPFAGLCQESVADELAEDPKDARDRLAALITAPQNERFAQTIANRLWQRLMGRGIVEPVEDWERGRATHPELLRWLGREFVRGGYRTKHILRLVMNSHAYQRASNPARREPSPLYVSPAPRRMSAEQTVDSLFAATGKPLVTEEVNLDVDGQRDLGNSISLGVPRRAWMLASTSNERDRPSLSLPRVQAVVDVLAAFGWRPARPDPATTRDAAVNILQPAVLANSPVSTWLTRLSDDHGVTRAALAPDLSLDEFLDSLFLRLLSRLPTDGERAKYRAHLAAGFEERIQPDAPATSPPTRPSRQPPRYVSWSNHLSEEANEIKLELEALARRGDPPTARLTAAWRERAEDVLWALINSPEFGVVR